MNRTACLILLLCFLGLLPAQARSNQEKIVRDTYRKLENYNAAAQVFRNELKGIPLRSEANLKFDLSDFRSGNIQDILNKPYAEIVTMPGGDVISLTRGGHSLDGGPQEATYAAEWEHGQYASVFDPIWTVADVLHFEAARYYDITSYVSYQVSVRFEGRMRTYRAVALFHQPTDSSDVGAPEFWDTIVNTVGSVWEDKRPPYKAKSGIVIESSGSSSTEPSVSAVSGDGTSAVSGDGTSDTSFSTTPLKFWLSLDATEHASGSHGGTAQFTGECFKVPNNNQRCEVNVSNFAGIESGTLDHVTPFFWHFGSKDLKTENRTGALGTTISCASATGVAFSSCLIGSNCGGTASVSLSLLVASASASVVGGNIWHDVNAEHFSCSLAASAGGTCTTPAFDGTCPIGTVPNGSGLCCFSSTQNCSTTFANKCMMYGGDYDFLTCTCLGCDTCGGSPIVVDVAGDGIALTNPSDGVDFDLNGNGTRDRLGWTQLNSDDAWLALDRDGNGSIDKGAELFGDFTQQPPASNKNGFLALAQFDTNADGVIDKHDAVFDRLRLWQDRNHNGISEADELHTLASLNVEALELEFKESKRVDAFGNELKYRAKVRDAIGARVGRWAWDVFLSH
jgi:hypothetical protein